MIGEKYQNLITKDIEKIINYIFDNYDVTDKRTSQEINRTDVISHFLTKKENHIQRCCGVNQNGSRCSRNTLQNKMYCKIHILKYDTSFFVKREEEKEHKIEFSDIVFEKEIQQNKENLKKVFIDDSFYYTDEKYMYDTSTLEKVGFVENDEYVLSLDPFILQ